MIQSHENAERTYRYGAVHETIGFIPVDKRRYGYRLNGFVSHCMECCSLAHTLLTVNLKSQFASTTSKSSSAGGAGAAGMAAVEAAPTGVCFATISNVPSFGANA